MCVDFGSCGGSSSSSYDMGHSPDSRTEPWGFEWSSSDRSFHAFNNDAPIQRNAIERRSASRTMPSPNHTISGSARKREGIVELDKVL